MSKDKTTLSVVIPAYNEAANIASTLARLEKALRPHCAALEYIVVDDGSRDATAQTAEEAAPRAGIPGRDLRVVRHEHNRGYGGALRTGFYSAKNDWVLLFPADAQFEPDEIVLLLAEAAKVKKKELFIVWPWRRRRAEGWLRQGNARVYQWLIRTVLGVAVRDLDCGMKLYHREVFYRLPPLTSEGALIDAEILTHARRHAIHIRQLGVTHLPRAGGTATGNHPAVVLRMFKELWKFRAAAKR